MKRLIFFSILSIAALVQLSAQSHQRITLIDGTVVEGYVSTRHFGKEFLLTAVETEMSMPSSLAGIIASQNQKVEYIPDAWKKWLKKHPEAVTPGSKTLDLSRMSVRDIAVAPLPADADDAQKFDYRCAVLNNAIAQKCTADGPIFITERGETLRFISLNPCTYSIRPSDILTTSYPARDPKLITGLEDELRLKNGETIVGQILEVKRGEFTRIKDNGGTVLNINSKDIAELRVKALNPDIPLIKQSPQLDIVTTKGKELTGVITARIYSKPNDPGHIILTSASGTETRVNFSDITIMRVGSNPDYSPMAKISLADDECFFNRDPEDPNSDIYLAKAIRCKPDKEGQYLLSADNDAVAHRPVFAFDKIENLVVELLNDESNKDAKLIKLRAVSSKKKGGTGGRFKKNDSDNDDGTPASFTFSTDDLALNYINELTSTVTNADAIIRKEYAVPAPGVYAIFLRAKSSCFLVEIQ